MKYDGLNANASELTIRDVIAAHILGGFAANPSPEQGITVVEVGRAYLLADECLAARVGLQWAAPPADVPPDAPT